VNERRLFADGEVGFLKRQLIRPDPADYAFSVQEKRNSMSVDSPNISFPRIRAMSSVVLVIDMQKDNVIPGRAMFNPEAHRAIAPNRRLLEFARKIGLRIIFITHAHRANGTDMGKFVEQYDAIREHRALIEGTEGADVCDELQPCGDEIIIVKRRHSGFYGTDLDIVLRSLGIDTVVITGLATSSCVLSTARDAIAHDYRTIVLGDACTAAALPNRGWGQWSGDDIHLAGLTVMASNTGRVMTVDAFIAQIRSDGAKEIKQR
jgi:ureidoacrylate peracid hydrolase